MRTLSKGPTPCLSDPRVLFAVKGAHVILDTAARFGEGDENSAGDNMRGLATDIFALLGSGARTVIAANHSPKPFARENTMRLENVLRGSGDIGAMLTTAWGVKQLDAAANIIHIRTLSRVTSNRASPFKSSAARTLTLAETSRFSRRPGECGLLMEEQEPERDKGGAPVQAREARAANLELLRTWLTENDTQTSEELAQRFKNAGIAVSAVTVRKYRAELSK